MLKCELLKFKSSIYLDDTYFNFYQRKVENKSIKTEAD